MNCRRRMLSDFFVTTRSAAPPSTRAGDIAPMASAPPPDQRLGWTVQAYGIAAFLSSPGMFLT